MSKLVIPAIIILILIAFGYLLLVGEPVQPISQTTNSDVITVAYTNDGFSPSTLSIKNGDTVTFQNQSTKSMWTASDAHPSHRGYPTKGGCLGSTFDSCTGVQQNDTWSFTFDISGSWEYHNHLSPSDTGTIIVE